MHGGACTSRHARTIVQKSLGALRTASVGRRQDRRSTVDEDEAEEVARQASVESGLDDRPRCDPRTLAISYLGLTLIPWPRVRARLDGGVLWYPAEVDEQAQAYLVAHECGHDLVRGERLEGQHLERVCSRIGCALILPRRAFLRDLRMHGPDLDALAALWPLASRWVIARRVAEVACYHAHRDRRGRISLSPLNGDALRTRHQAAAE